MSVVSSCFRVAEGQPAAMSLPLASSLPRAPRIADALRNCAASQFRRPVPTVQYSGSAPRSNQLGGRSSSRGAGLAGNGNGRATRFAAARRATLGAAQFHAHGLAATVTEQPPRQARPHGRVMQQLRA
eukprot:6181886-Pleurochrysis_carterae.AAC.4